MSKSKILIDSALVCAKKYSSRSAFFKGDQSAYEVLRRRGLLESACIHMPLSPKYSYVRWTKDTAIAEASKYSSRSEFKRSNPGAYEFCLSNSVLDCACAHMRLGQKFWNIFELMAVALKYQNHSDFKSLEPAAYNYAVKAKLLGTACSHMERATVSWTKNLVMVEAAKHQQRGLFMALASGAYKHAYQYGYLDEACAHMLHPEYGFSKEKPATLYQLKITAADGFIIYKVGITNRTPEARIAGMRLNVGVTAEILDTIHFESGRDARMVERRLHRKFSGSRYDGPPVMQNGNTELFTVNILES